MGAPGLEPGGTWTFPTTAGDPGPDAAALRTLCLSILEFRDWPTTWPSTQRGLPGLPRTRPLTTGLGHILPHLQVHTSPYTLPWALSSRPRGHCAAEERTQLAPSQGVWMCKVVSRNRLPQPGVGTHVLGRELRRQASWGHPSPEGLDTAENMKFNDQEQ